MTPAGTSNELDVQNGWEENTHTNGIISRRKLPLYYSPLILRRLHFIPQVGVGKERHINWSMVTCKMATPVTGTTLRTTDDPVPADSRQ